MIISRYVLDTHPLIVAVIVNLILFIVAGFSPEQWACQVQKLQPLHSTVHVPPPPSCAYGASLSRAGGQH